MVSSQSGAHANVRCAQDRYSPPDIPRNRAWVLELLSYIDPDCDDDNYRNIIWGIEANTLTDAENMSRAWSLIAPERFLKMRLPLFDPH